MKNKNLYDYTSLVYECKKLSSENKGYQEDIKYYKEIIKDLQSDKAFYIVVFVMYSLAFILLQIGLFFGLLK